jgi:hypothetical protein
MYCRASEIDFVEKLKLRKKHLKKYLFRPTIPRMNSRSLSQRDFIIVDFIIFRFANLGHIGARAICAL